MTARDEVESILSERGPATVAEIAEALSNVYTPHTVSVAVARLKKAGIVVLTGDKVQGDRGRPAEVVALNRELERARNKREAEENLRQAAERVKAGNRLYIPLHAAGTDHTAENAAYYAIMDSSRWEVTAFVDAAPKPSVWQRVKRLFGVG